jgi:hypothetical protein
MTKGQEMSKYIKIEDIDLAWDNTSETFNDILEEIGQKFPNAFLRIVRIVGSGGGWPTIDAVMPESDFEAFMENLGHDSSDIEFFKESVIPL